MYGIDIDQTGVAEPVVAEPVVAEPVVAEQPSVSPIITAFTQLLSSPEVQQLLHEALINKLAEVAQSLSIEDFLAIDDLARTVHDTIDCIVDEALQCSGIEDKVSDAIDEALGNVRITFR